MPFVFRESGLLRVLSEWVIGILLRQRPAGVRIIMEYTGRPYQTTKLSVSLAKYATESV
jgi:hypothetical protein